MYPAHRHTEASTAVPKFRGHPAPQPPCPEPLCLPNEVLCVRQVVTKREYKTLMGACRDDCSSATVNLFRTKPNTGMIWIWICNHLQIEKNIIKIGAGLFSQHHFKSSNWKHKKLGIELCYSISFYDHDLLTASQECQKVLNVFVEKV